MATTQLEKPKGGGLGDLALRTLRAMPRAWNRFWRLVALYMPKRLYARSLIIVVAVRVQLEGKVLRVFVRRSQAYASNTHIFLIWMVGTSLVLLMIAIPFLRNQIRPILTLAEAAESFGKGRPMPRDFRPRGAEEVRRAGCAFIQR